MSDDQPAGATKIRAGSDQLTEPVKLPGDALQELDYELTDKETRLLARLSRDRGLYAECKSADLGALQELGLLQWFDTRSSTTRFKQDPRPLLRLHGISGRIDYAWVAAVENWRELVGPEVSAKVDAIDEFSNRKTVEPCRGE